MSSSILNCKQHFVGSIVGAKLRRFNPTIVNNATRSSTRRVAVVRSSMDIEGAGASGYAVGGFRPTSPKAWEIMSTSLRKSKLKMISPQEVAFALKRGTKVIDIRPEAEYTGGRIPGAVSVKFFRLIEGWAPMKIARRGVYAFFGIINGTEFNERFFQEFEQAVPKKNETVILYCNIGGTLDPTGPSEFGQQSRSLAAAYELLRAGYKNVQVLKGGYNDWRKSGRDIEFEV
jgi:rhodanese-related sulfurtransferase